MSENKRSFRHVIREGWCKGCGICVAFCPKKVLALQGGKVKAVTPDDCIGCRMCELRCPDFAIEIHEREREPVTERAASTDYDLPPEADHA